MSTSALDMLYARGLVEQVTNETKLREKLAQPGASMYIGFDPTAVSLHVGNLVQIMVLAHLQRAGHRPICLVGGATGMIGDPSGRSDERELLTPDLIRENVEGIRAQLAQFMAFDGDNAAQMVNNADWIGPMSYIDWLRDVGKYFTVNYMTAKESVKNRLGRDQGISYTEFSYMLLQAYDFLHLYRTADCTIQAGGSDQWGNITAGIELIRKAIAGEAYGITTPLITTSSGEKFGKSAGNAIWLDPARTSPYQFYQFWVRADDQDVARYLKLFTFLGLEEIEALERTHAENPGRRVGQRRLAEEVTRIVHGEAGLQKAQRATDILFGQEIAGLSDADLNEIFADVPSTEFSRERLAEGIGLIDFLAETGILKSKGEARRSLQGGAVNLNNRRSTNLDQMLTLSDLASETTLVIRIGKKRYHLVRFI